MSGAHTAKAREGPAERSYPLKWKVQVKAWTKTKISSPLRKYKVAWVTLQSKDYQMRGAWLAQSAERVTPYFGVVSSSPTVRVEITLKKLKKKFLHTVFKGWIVFFQKSTLLFIYLTISTQLCFYCGKKKTNITLNSAILLTCKRTVQQYDVSFGSIHIAMHRSLELLHLVKLKPTNHTNFKYFM